MKKIYASFGVFCLLGIGGVFAIDDTQVLDALKKETSEVTSPDLKMQSFESCQAFEDVMEKYIGDYWEKSYKNRPIYGPIYRTDMIMEDAATVESIAPQSEKSANGVAGGKGDDFSETNLQVAGVEESDIAKTDGKYVYSFSEDKKAVFIIEAQADGKLELVKKILLPKSFYGVELFVTTNRLVITASAYSNIYNDINLDRGFYIQRNNKSYAIVYDTSDIQNPELMRLSSIEGNITQTRMIGDTLYMLTSNFFDIPYYNYKSRDDISIKSTDILPKTLDIAKNENSSGLRSLILKGKKLPYSIESGSVSDCSSIMYHFPSEDTLEKIPFSQSYTMITALDTRDTSVKNTTQVIAGSNNQIHMSLENLYLTEGIYFSSPWSCPFSTMCIMPRFFGGTQNTLIHKFNIDDMNMKYQDTAIVSGSPLTQYSMDEYQGNFRIITSEWNEKSSTSLHILNPNLEKLSSLSGLAPGEKFRGNRFIGEKLFLVTFQQIDPLFVIDVADPKKPQVLGELKIPGFSTYLHPYDENHLIGLGYDTGANQWGGTEQRGVKLDLYKINYDKKCGDSGLTLDMQKKCESGDYKGIIVEQVQTKTFGGKGSTTEASYNPRMFIWNKNKNILLLPVTLTDYDQNWRMQDYYNGALAVSISPQGINEVSRTSHLDLDIGALELERKKACEPYLKQAQEPKCRKLINGQEVCETGVQNGGYIPNYCYEDSSIWSYIGENSWKYQTKNIQRMLYIGENVYSLSQDEVRSHSWDLSGRSKLELK